MLDGAQDMGHDVTFVMNPISSLFTIAVTVALLATTTFVPLSRQRLVQFFFVDRPVTLGDSYDGAVSVCE